MGSSRLRVRNYPAQREKAAPGQLRAGAHTDYGSLTILKTEDRPGGLQVIGPGGAWLDVPIRWKGTGRRPIPPEWYRMPLRSSLLGGRNRVSS